MSKCPKCGGLGRRMLAPGYFMCTTTVLRGVIPAGTQGNTSPIPVEEPCGHRYQEATGAANAPSATCECGIFAVGVCRECERAVCGRHSEVVGIRLACTWCLQEQAAAQARREADKKEQREAAAVEEREAALRALKQQAHATARTLSAAAVPLHRIVIAERQQTRPMHPESRPAVWYVATEEVGVGWHALDSVTEHVILRHDGALFDGIHELEDGPYRRLGRHFRSVRAKALAVSGPMRFTEHTSPGQLEYLRRRLSSLASNPSPPGKPH